MPDDTTPYFMGERPYLPVATLLDALVEPQPPNGFAEGVVAGVLVDVGLARLVPLLDTVSAWEQEVGIEDQQRLGFARALLHKPRWILMHDATSVLDAATEDNLMELLAQRLPDAALISIAHRRIAEWRFQRRISLSRTDPGSVMI